MKKPSAIDILLATYNGERFLTDQIYSLLKQTYVHWRLHIRDDGSTDGTRAILAKFQKQYPDKITVIEDELGNLGPRGNFNELLRCSNADYVMFCDQDDVWHPEKVSLTLEGMLKAVEKYGERIPLLVHTDLTVVDQNLAVLSGSLWKRQHYAPHAAEHLNRLLVQNVVTGCTVMINRAAKDVAFPIPQDALMHDWWLALAVSALGKVICLEQTTALYRQHSGNVAGARWNMAFYLNWLRTLSSSSRKHRQFLLLTQRQAETFGRRYQEWMQPAMVNMITAYGELGGKSWLTRKCLMARYGFWASGLARNAGLFVML